MARLVLESGEGAGASFELGASAVIGRLKSCDIPIKDKKSSRTNCRVLFEGGVHVLEDLGSSNGTFLNGQKVDRATLKHGDRIAIGGTVLRFETDETPRAAPSGAPVRPPIKQAAVSPPRARVPPAVPVPLRDASVLASIETPPDGIRPPGGGPVQPGPAEAVEELDLGGGDGEAPAPAPRPLPPAAPPPVAPPTPRKEYVPRTALRDEKPSGKGGAFLFQDVSQRSTVFQALVALAAAGIVAGLGYLAFRLAGSLF